MVPFEIFYVHSCSNVWLGYRFVPRQKDFLGKFRAIEMIK